MAKSSAPDWNEASIPLPWHLKATSSIASHPGTATRIADQKRKTRSTKSGSNWAPFAEHFWKRPHFPTMQMVQRGGLIFWTDLFRKTKVSPRHDRSIGQNARMRKCGADHLLGSPDAQATPSPRSMVAICAMSASSIAKENRSRFWRIRSGFRLLGSTA